MKARHIAIYKIHGANSLPADAESTKLLVLQDSSVTAILTKDPDPHFIHVDVSTALGIQGLKGLGFLAPSKEGSPQERLAAEIQDIKAQRTKRTGAGVFLVFDGETDIPTPEFKARRDTDEFGICIDSIDKSEIRRTFLPSIESVVAALSLGLPENTSRNIEKIGDVIFLIEPDNPKPIYALNFQISLGRPRISGALTASAMAESRVLTPKIAADNTMARLTGFLIRSLDDATDKSQAFIAAWSALEIFVNASFKSTYEARWFDMMEHGAPELLKPLIERFTDVPREEYYLARKFRIIASMLDVDFAAADATEFQRLNQIRNNFYHGQDMPLSALPTEQIQKLLPKYLRLHLLAQG